MLKKVISGGETGVDQVALEAAKRCGIPTGGWIGNGFLTEKGPDPTLKDKYGLIELGQDYMGKSVAAQHVGRTIYNIKTADGTLVLGLSKYGDLGGPGTRKTLGFCLLGRWTTVPTWRERIKKPARYPVLVIEKIDTEGDAHARLASFIAQHKIETLNIAGPRGTKMAGSFEQNVSLVMGLLVVAKGVYEQDEPV